MRRLALVSSFWVAASVAMLGCTSSNKGLGSGGQDSGVSAGGAGGGAATGGNLATGGAIGTGGAAGQGGNSLLGQGGSGSDAGIPGAGGLTGTGGMPNSGGAPSSGGTISDGGGTRTGGSTGAGMGGLGSGGAATGGAAAGGSGTGGAGTGGASGVGGTAGSGGGGSGLGGFGGHKACQSDADCAGFKCCGNLCSNTQNDILNCGGCGILCPDPAPYCGNGRCGKPPCQGATCGAGTSCCGTQCCGAGQVCCTVTIGPDVLGCFDPVDGTCPTGCAACACAAPSTPIATPQGERPIAELKVGDWVYSVDHGQIRPVPIKRINRHSVLPSHTMMSLRLASGRSLLVSPEHPTADGRTFQQLARGDRLDGVAIVDLRRVGYDQPFTYDILPDSDSGAYFAASVLIGSTLASPAAQPLVSSVVIPKLAR